MIKLIWILIISYSYAVDLLQETKDIKCTSPQASVLIDKRDRFIEVEEKGVKKTFTSVEFLDSAILLKSKTSTDYALIQLTAQNKALVIMGELIKFTEGICKDTGASKMCYISGKELFWTPEIMSLGSSVLQATQYEIHHYGVYPNDGTYFIGLSAKNLGLGLIDFGSNISLVSGKSLSFESCSYN